MLVVTLVLAIRLATRPEVADEQLTPVTDILSGDDETADDSENETTEQTARAETEQTETQETQESQETPEPVEETTSSKYVVTNKRVNIRAEADSSSEKLGTVDEGTILPLLGYAEDWVMVTYEGQTAYVYGIYVDETESAPSQTETEESSADEGTTEE